MIEPNDPDKQESVKKARILVVDDSKVVRLAATRILSTQFDLVLAEDGEEAWQKICEDNTIQVVFTDLGMPKLDGYGLIKRIRESENEGIRNQPVIVITGAAEEEDVKRKVFELGATDFITKPFKSTEVIARAEAHASYRRDKENLKENIDIDLITGTLNSNGLNKQLRKDVSFVNRHNENLALIIFELDDFKTIYKRIGEQGSKVIVKQAAATLLAAVRKEDSVGRYGAEKFIVVLPMAKMEGVIILAKRICESVKSFKMAVGGKPLPISVSAGIAIVRKGTPFAIKSLIETADRALANAKKVGAGEVQILKLETAHANEAPLKVSIDSILEAISSGKTEMAVNQMDEILTQLLPLVALMNSKQKLRMIK